PAARLRLGSADLDRQGLPQMALAGLRARPCHDCHRPLSQQDQPMVTQDRLTATLVRPEIHLLKLHQPAGLLRVEGLSVSYGANEVVRNVGFELGPGKSLALIGESGSGKSTIARAVLRLLPSRGIATGRVEFHGQ